MSLKKFFTLFFILLLGAEISAQVYEGTRAAVFHEDAEVVRFRSLSPVPNYIRFRGIQDVPNGDLVAFTKNVLDLGPEYDLEMIRTEHDELGFLHLRMQQTYQGIPVEGGVYLIHYKTGEGIHSINGEIFPISAPQGQAMLAENQALQEAMHETGAQVYKWQIPAEAAIISQFPYEQYYHAHGQPKGVLTYVPVDGDFDGGNFRLAYKFDIYAHQPMSRTFTFVDAETGEILWQEEQIHTIDTLGTAVTTYTGTQTITTDLTGSWYRLKESGRGNGIETLNLQQGTNYGAAIDFVDADNYWNNFNAQQDEVATDVHFATEMTYDYYFDNFGRNSIDGSGFALFSYLHFSQNYGNAFWNGQAMTYGDGGFGVPNPLTSVDIAGHEITHGLTDFTANLIYSYESGALNESFSDIFGNAIERFAKPQNNDWRVGEDIGFVIRNMSNPNQFGDPDTYGGTNWWTAPGDNGGVHINSGVQNYWFYLLTEGGSGINDNGNNYNINGIGIEKAGAIAYRNLVTYLTPTSDFGSARFYSVQAAGDLYGGCSPEMIETANAWFAVGVGTLFSTPTVTSEFEALNTEICSYPNQIRFRNKSAFANQYFWDFGDGTTSTDFEPTHTYQNPGTYSVTLSVRSDCDTNNIVFTRNNYITVSTPPSAPVAQSEEGFCESSVMLTASGSGELEWRDENGRVVAIGDTFTTPILHQSTTYQVFSREDGATGSLGPESSSIGVGGYLLDINDQYLNFSVFKPMVLKSVLVNSNSIRQRTIHVWDENGKLITSLDRTIFAGPGRVDLNVFLTPGNYRIGGKLMDLYVNSRGANYPYTLSGVGEITGSSDIDPRAYYFFYDWDVAEVCVSAPTQVEAIIKDLEAPTVEDVETCGEESVTLFANTSEVVNWYDENQNLVQTGSSFQTPVLTQNTRYFAEVEKTRPSLNIGPTSFAIGAGNFDQTTQADYLEFTVHYPVVLESFLINAGSAGDRNILLMDEGGKILQTRRINLPFGLSTVPINLELQPGQYRLGGRLMDLFFNTSGVNYPFSYPGILDITGSSNGPGTYYFFYNWKVKPLSCVSEREEVNITIGPENLPLADFETTQDYNTISIQDQSQNTNSWLWDFGDGNISTNASPKHTYSQKGVYTVTLIAQNGSCEEVKSEDIFVDFIPGELVFEATLVDRNDVRLDWQVNGALDSDFYDAEYAKEGAFDFENLATLDAADPEVYQHFATEFSPGHYRFRIRQVDTDGNFRYSQVEDILILPPDPNLKAYPSPANASSVVEVQLPSEGEYRLRMYNDMGQAVQTFHEGKLDAGAHTFELNASRYGNGMYYLRLEGESLNLVQKVLIIN